MKKRYLMTPGPTPVPEDVMLSMSEPIIHHRTPQFMEILKEAIEGLKYVLQTKADVYLFASSGTGAMEASVCNLLSPGDKAIVVRAGKFGERFGEICESFGVKVVPIDVEWSTSVSASTIKELLNKNKDVKAVFTTLCETSTAVLTDIKAIGEVVKDTNACLVVDLISGLCADEFKMDEWNVDVAVNGSQKGLMLPPGLAFVGVSKKAWGLIENSKSPKYYFDLKRYKKAFEKIDVPWTPAITLIKGLNTALRKLKEDGLENIWRRSSNFALATREALRVLNLEIYSKSPSNAVTAAVVPGGIDGEKLVSHLRDKYGVTIAGGQSELKGKIFRIAHMGYILEFDLIVAISAVEIILKKMGYKFQFGSGVKKMMEVINV